MATLAEFIGMLDTAVSFKMWNDASPTWLAAIPAEMKLAVTVNTKPRDVQAQRAHSFPFFLPKYLFQSVSIAAEDHALYGTSSITAPVAWPGDRFKRQRQAGWPQEKKKEKLFASA